MLRKPVLNLSERIKELRSQRGWSQDRLAEKVGVSRPSVTQWESGVTKNIKNETLVGLAAAFDMSVDELLTGHRSIREPAAAYFSNDEEELLSRYRSLSADDRIRVLAILNALASISSGEHQTS